jgi:hypothetical protein
MDGTPLKWSTEYGGKQVSHCGHPGQRVLDQGTPVTKPQDKNVSDMLEKCRSGQGRAGMLQVGGTGVNRHQGQLESL